MTPESPSIFHPQAYLKTEGERLLLVLPKISPEAESSWAEIWQELEYSLKKGERTWPAGTPVHLVAGDQLLDSRQLQACEEMLQKANLQLKFICTSRRQTAVTAAGAGYSVEQEPLARPLSPVAKSPPSLPADPLYLKTTVRSGIAIRHPGTVVIRGDVNPGGEIIAQGDILVWGHLRGVAHAGADGNAASCIMALRFGPAQLRIAERVARVSPTPAESFEPEVAYVTPEGIRISPALNFSKTQAKKGLNPLRP